jgi:CopG family nickel-responsive transcriptional regulator
MSDLARIGVAIETKLLASFDALIAKLGYTNRSEAFRDLIRERLVREGSENPNQEVVGALTLVYDHHKRNLNDKLTELQHDHHANIVSTLHVHLDHDNCLEVLILRGKAKTVRKIAELLISVKGIQHGQLAISAPNAEQLSPHSHTHDHSH